MKIKTFAAIICLLFLSAAVDAAPYKVALFSPKGDSPFWTLVSHLAKEAADDLGMSLQVYDAKLSQYKMLQQLEKAVSGPDRVDAVLFSNFKQFGPKFIKIVEKEKVFAFLFNSGLTPDQQKEMGKPRGKYKYWIGQILPDDEGAAQAAAALLVEEAKKHQLTGPDGKIHMVGISGIASDASSMARVSGLRHSVEARKDVILHQVVSTDYGAQMGKEKFLWLIKRYPQTSAVWSASYRITNGILEGMQERQLGVGRRIFTNSVVLNQTALERVKSGELVTTFGGHYIEGAWVVVMLYDFLCGIDFAEQSTEMRTPMGIVTKNNVDLYLEKITNEKLSEKNLKKIDFTWYSKKMNPELTAYEFNLDSVLEQL